MIQRLSASQQCDDACGIDRLADPTERCHRCRTVECFLRCTGVQQVSLYGAQPDGIDGDTPGAVFAGDDSGELFDGGLTSRIGGLARTGPIGTHGSIAVPIMWS